jgi:hypothetical protein
MSGANDSKQTFTHDILINEIDFGTNSKTQVGFDAIGITPQPIGMGKSQYNPSPKPGLRHTTLDFKST